MFKLNAEKVLFRAYSDFLCECAHKSAVNRKRNKTLTVRLTEDEKNAIAEKANQAHMTHTKSTLTMQPAQKALDMVTGRCYNDHHRINRLLTQKGK